MRKKKRSTIRSKSMAVLRSPIFIGLALVMFLGIAVYLRLWAIDSTFSYQDNEMLRKQFDLANREAMEESADWRMRYDEEVQRATARLRELEQVKEALHQRTGEVTDMKNKLSLVEKENLNLLARVELMKQELETAKLKCKTRKIR